MSLLDDTAKAIYMHLELIGGDPQKLPVAQQPIAILYTLQAMIDNGGLRYIFESDFLFWPPYSTFVSAYRVIGATEAADGLEKAVALFPFANPHTNSVARNEFMSSLDESDEFFALGDEVCGDERIWQLMEQYAAGISITKLHQ